MQQLVRSGRVPGAVPIFPHLSAMREAEQHVRPVPLHLGAVAAAGAAARLCDGRLYEPTSEAGEVGLDGGAWLVDGRAQRAIASGHGHRDGADPVDGGHGDGILARLLRFASDQCDQGGGSDFLH